MHNEGPNPDAPDGAWWAFQTDRMRVPMNTAKAREFLRAMLAVAMQPPNIDSTIDPLVAWLRDPTNTTTLLAVVRMMRVGESMMAMLDLFDGIRRAGDECDPQGIEPGNVYPRWRQQFVDTARQLLGELVEIEAAGKPTFTAPATAATTPTTTAEEWLPVEEAAARLSQVLGSLVRPNVLKGWGYRKQVHTDLIGGRRCYLVSHAIEVARFKLRDK